MATKKITNITRADLASLIEGYSASQNKVGVLSKSDANTQSKEPAANSQPVEPSRSSNRLINDGSFIFFPPNASAKNNARHHSKMQNSFLVPPKILEKRFISQPKPATD